MIRKTYTTAVKTIGPRSIRAICSTGDIDRTGEIVVQSGLDLTLYRANPIVLFSHQPECPVGLATAVAVVNGKLTADITFADAGVSPKADEVCALVKAGILKSISIGFDPSSMAPMDPSRPRGPQRYLSASLVEVSIVAVPANPNAVITDKSYESGMKTPITPVNTMEDTVPTQAQLREKARKFQAGNTPTPPARPQLTGRAAQVQRDADHAYHVLDLQRKANPTPDDRRAAASRLAFKQNPAGY